MIVVKIDEMIRKALNTERSITPNKRLVEDLGFDSLKLMELVARIEDELNVSMSMKALIGVKTVSDVHGLIRSIAERRGT